MDDRQDDTAYASFDGGPVFANLGDLPSADIEAMAYIVLMEAAADAQEDLKAIMQRVKDINQQKQHLREILDAMRNDAARAEALLRSKLDSLNEMGEMESLRLQMAMDRLSKLMSTLSNILKKMSDTASSITQNIK